MSLIALVLAATLTTAQNGHSAQKHTFTFGGRNNEEFLLDGKPFQLRGGELDPGRVPSIYWRHRIQMAKAMGLNTIAPYIFWNDHERTEGKWDFKTESRDIARFFKICQEEKMWVLLRPGPYVCGEWDGGGLPSYLWKYPDTKFRSMDDNRYTDAVARYIHELAKVAKPYLVENGGPIVMTQIENEYGSYPRHDHQYIVWLHDLMVKEGFKGKFSTSDGPSVNMLKDSTVPGVAVGLDSGGSEADWETARKVNPGVPIFSGETYPGWLRHWGEKDWEPSDVTDALKFYMQKKKSFNLYLVHGGTNFGFTTGANHGGKGYEPDVTSYDYGCPISEQGLPTKEYFKYRELLQSSLSVEKLIDVPKPIPAMDIPPIEMRPLANLGRHTMPRRESDLPMSFEELGQNQGIIAYQTKLRPGSSGKLTFERLSDYAHIEIDGKNIGILDRRLGQKEIELPDGNGKDERTLTIIIEGMGHINYSAAMDTDRKGISGVMYGGVLLKDWINVKFPLDDSWVSNLSWKTEQGHMGGVNYGDSFLISRGVFQLKSTADTFLDMHQYKRGMVWVNGHNLGRFWDIGPQFRLYCPTSWLKIGKNTITVLDTDQVASDDNVLKPLHIRGFTAMR